MFDPESALPSFCRMSQPIFKIVASEGCQSYLVGCPHTREALLVDPKVGQEKTYAHMLKRYRLQLRAVLDTHTHADHLSAGPRFVGEGVKLYMSSVTGVARDMHKLSAGDEVAVGELRFRVLAVPGHTPDSIALHGHGMVLTGDSLLIGGLARADFKGSDPAQLFESVQSELMSLPDETLVLPGHSYGDLLFSTIGCERESNEALGFPDGAAYAASLGAKEGAGNTPAVEAMLALNVEPAPDLPNEPGNAAACCASPTIGTRADIEEVPATEAQEVHAALAGPNRWIDVRDPFEYEAGRIPGTTSIPLSELGFHLDQLRGKEPLYLSCRSGVRSMTAAKTLQRLGVENPINIGGGILGWQSQGHPIEGEPAT